ncbi:MAG: nucleoside hydrolase [Chloroflexi bacterium]|nr:nucleoside hydrolase [Chloroflexota bacterium]
MKRTLIDTDPGTDDALALLMALRSPELAVEGVTTVGGNAPVRQTTRNAIGLLEAFGCRDLPVAGGAARPLRGRYRYAYDFHGRGGLTVRLPRPVMGPRRLPAHLFLLSKAYAFAGELVVVCLGPLTNIARAIRAEPRFRQMVKELVVMGGAVQTPGNVTPYAEFNTYNDPEAAQAVMDCGVPVTLVGLDVCRQVLLTRADLPRLEVNDGATHLLGDMMANWFRLHPEKAAYDLCDPLAMAATIEPGVLVTETRHVRVVTEGSERGRTVAVDGRGHVRVATTVDVERFFSLFWARTLGGA